MLEGPKSARLAFWWRNGGGRPGIALDARGQCFSLQRFTPMVGVTSLENAFVRVDVDTTTGTITRIVDKVSGRDVLATGGLTNVLEVFGDRPSNWDAWDIGYTGERWEVTETADVRRGANSEHAWMSFTRRWGRSTFTQTLELTRAHPWLEVRTVADWQERRKLLKVGFRLATAPDSLMCAIPYGAIGRTGRPRTQAERAKYEFPCQRWVDAADSGGGAAVITDSKYGWDYRGDTLRLSLLRAPLWPDSLADRGRHVLVVLRGNHALVVRVGLFDQPRDERRAVKAELHVRLTHAEFRCTGLQGFSQNAQRFGRHDNVLRDRNAPQSRVDQPHKAMPVRGHGAQFLPLRLEQNTHHGRTQFVGADREDGPVNHPAKRIVLDRDRSCALKGGYLGILLRVLTGQVVVPVRCGERDATRRRVYRERRLYVWQGTYRVHETLCGNGNSSILCGACAVACASIDLLLESPWQARVVAIETACGNHLQQCRNWPGVRDVRVKGAIGVLELEQPVNLPSLTRRLLERGVWLRPFGRLVYLMPPYIIGADDLHRLLTAMTASIGEELAV